MIQIKPLAVKLLLVSFSAQAAPSIMEATCIDHSNTKRITRINIDQRVVTIDNTDKDCSSTYMYYKKSNNDTVIFAGPSGDELGLNAQNDIFIKSETGKIAKSIGSIPVASIPGNDETYVNITQSGGSVFKTIYAIKDQEIDLIPSGLELIFSDTQCIYDTSNSQHCRNMTGTFEKPICIQQIDNKKILQPQEACADMEAEIVQPDN
ncbi:hypothetical protein [Pseudomonas citronellolis]|uniref:hypothetical protein n=1 Tax=Pseudomonas citronellolis TaxID=53408 RepID=UPI000A705FD6|nr:hypothetical protein [Pseudomonas humi]